MFQFLQTWDGARVAQFGVEHIGYIRKAMLYGWLTSRKCCLDLTSFLIFADKGCFIKLLYPPFIFFCLLLGSASLWASGLHCYFYMWAALLYTSAGCIAVEKWAALLFFICGLH